MKKRILTLFIIPCIALLVLTACSKNETNKKFYLNKEMYGNTEFIEITGAELENIIEENNSFAVFVYQPLCTTSYDFNTVLSEFIDEHNMTFYKISFAEMKETSLSKNIEHYPSFAIYKKGVLVDYLDAESDEDLVTYKTIEGFKTWFTKYVKLKKAEHINTSGTTNVEKEEKIDAEIENITYDPNKVNIYFFWGDGCPHCEEQFEFLESIETEYSDYFNLYTFEVWYNEENEKILKQFASIMGDELKGVPYTVIGKETFKGFAESMKESMLDAIETQYQNSYDVYFDNKKD